MYCSGSTLTLIEEKKFVFSLLLVYSLIIRMILNATFEIANTCSFINDTCVVCKYIATHMQRKVLRSNSLSVVFSLLPAVLTAET